MTIIITILVETKTCHLELDRHVCRDDNDVFFFFFLAFVDKRRCATEAYNAIRFPRHSI